MRAGRGTRETSSEFLRAGRSSASRSGLQTPLFTKDSSKNAFTICLTKENESPRNSLFIEDPRWGGHFPRAGTRKTHLFNYEFTLSLVNIAE